MDTRAQPVRPPAPPMAFFDPNHSPATQPHRAATAPDHAVASTAPSGGRHVQVR